MADAFQALAQERPYRGAQPLEKIERVLGDFVARGVLDGELVALACENLDGSWLAATQPLTDIPCR